MGEISEMMLDGTLCSCCGEYIDSDDNFDCPQLCYSCEQDEKKEKAKKAKLKKKNQSSPTTEKR